MVDIPANTPAQTKLKKLAKKQLKNTVAPPLFTKPEQEDKSLFSPFLMPFTKMGDIIQAGAKNMQGLSEDPWLHRVAKQAGSATLGAIASVPIPEQVKKSFPHIRPFPGSQVTIPEAVRGGQVILRPLQAAGGLTGPGTGLVAEYGTGAVSPSKRMEIQKRITEGGLAGEKEIAKDIVFNRQKASEVGSLITNLLSGQISPRQFAGQLIEVQESKAFWDQLISEVPFDIIPYKIPSMLRHMAQGRPRQTIIKAAQEATEAAPDKPIIEGIFRIVDEDEPRRVLPKLQAAAADTGPARSTQIIHPRSGDTIETYGGPDLGFADDISSTSQQHWYEIEAGLNPFASSSRDQYRYRSGYHVEAEQAAIGDGWIKGNTSTENMEIAIKHADIADARAAQANLDPGPRIIGRFEPTRPTDPLPDDSIRYLESLEPSPTTRPIYQGPTPGEPNLQRFRKQVGREKLRSILTGRADTRQRLTDDGRIIIEDPEGNELFQLLKSDDHLDPRLRNPKYRGKRAREGRDIALGKKALLNRLKMEVNLSGLDKEVADIAEKWINMLPSKYLADLGSSFVQDLTTIGGSDIAKGFYQSLDPTTIWAGSKDSTRGIINIGLKMMERDVSHPRLRIIERPERTIIHEIAHHLEDFVSEDDIRNLRSQLDRELAPGTLGADVRTWNIDEEVRARVRRGGTQVRPARFESPEQELQFQHLSYRYGAGPEAHLPGGDRQFVEWFAEVMTDKAIRDVFMQMPEYRNIIQKVLDHIKAIARAIREYIRTVQGRPDYAERVYQKIIKGDYSAAERRTIRTNIMREDPYLLTSIEDIDPKHIGRTTRATGADPNKVYEFEYTVAELDDLIPSHTDALAANPQYIKELQPRIREQRTRSRRQVDQMAQRLNPDALLTETGTLDRGPMIIGPDMMVESGNGRVLALRKARADYADTYNEYTNSLSERLSEFGLSDDALEGMTNPVLVRKRVTDVDRAAFATEANAPSVLAMSPLEQALQDAQRLPDDVLAKMTIGADQTIEQALRAAANRGIVHSFMSTIPENESAALVTADDALNPQGLLRIKAALTAKIFPGEAGQRLTELFFENIDSEILTIQNAIFDTMPALARAEGLVRIGQRSEELGIGDNLARVIDQFAALKKDNMTVQDFLQQGAMFERALNPLEEKILLHFSRIQGKRTILRDFLRKYSKAVEDSPDPKQGMMFADDLETKENIINTIIAGQRQEFDLPDTMFDFVPPTTVAQVAEEVTGKITLARTYDAFKTNNAPRTSFVTPRGEDAWRYTDEAYKPGSGYMVKSDDTNRWLRWVFTLSDGRQVSLQGYLKATHPELAGRVTSGPKGLQKIWEQLSEEEKTLLVDSIPFEDAVPLTKVYPETGKGQAFRVLEQWLYENKHPLAEVPSAETYLGYALSDHLRGLRPLATQVAGEAVQAPIVTARSQGAAEVLDFDQRIIEAEQTLQDRQNSLRRADARTPIARQSSLKADIHTQTELIKRLTKSRKEKIISLLNERDGKRWERLPRIIEGPTGARQAYIRSRLRNRADNYEEKMEETYERLAKLEQDLADLNAKVRTGAEEAVTTIREVDITDMSTEQLKTWYKGLGFKFSKGDDWGSIKNPTGVKRSLANVKWVPTKITNRIVASLREDGGYFIVPDVMSVELPGVPSQSGMLIFDANNRPVLFVNFQVWYMKGSLGDVLRINNINVNPAYRREGIGTAFMRNLINSAQKENLSVHLKAKAGEGFIPQLADNQWVRNPDTPVQIDKVTGEIISDKVDEVVDLNPVDETAAIEASGGGTGGRPPIQPTATGGGDGGDYINPLLRGPRTLADMNSEARGMRALTPEQRAAVMDAKKPIEGEILYEHQPFSAAADRLLNPVETGTTRTAQEIGRVISKALNIPGGRFIRKALQIPYRVWSPANIVRDEPEAKIALIGFRRAIFVETESARIRLAALYWWDGAKEAFKFRQTGTTYGLQPWKGFWRSTNVQASQPKFRNNKMFGTINDMIEHPERYVFTPEQSSSLKIVQDTLTKSIRDAQRAGVDVVELSENYWHRMIKSGPKDKNILGFLRKRATSRKGYTRQRVLGDIDDVVGGGFSVETHPGIVFETRVESGMITIADQETRKQIAALPGIRKPKEILSERYPEVLINAEAARTARDIAKDVVKQAKDNVTLAEVNALRQAEADYISSMREVFSKRVETNQPGYTELRLPNGRIAPQEMVEDINKLIDLPELRNARAGAAAEFTREFFHMVRSTLTNVDLAAGFIQGQFVFYRNPRAWATAQAKSITALIDDPTAYVKENWDIMNEGIDIGAISPPTEFLFARQGFGTWPTKIPIAGPALRGFNRAFEWYIAVAQTELYKAARTGKYKEASIEELVSLGSAIRKEVGTESYAILGVRGTQQTIEALSLFSARFFRSTIGLIGQSFTGGPGGAEARKALFALMGGGMALLLGVATVKDRRLPNITDPYEPDWMQVRIGDSYFNPFFAMYPWMRTIARMGVQVEQGNFSEARQEGQRFIKSKASIPVRVLNIAGQLHFYGQARVYDNVIEKSWTGVPFGLLEEYSVPISMQDFIQDPLYLRDRPEAFVDPLGITSRPIILYTEWRKEIREFEKIPSDKDLKQGEKSRTDTRQADPLLEAKLFITETRNMSAFVGWNLENNPITPAMRMAASLIITHDVDYRSIKAIADRLEIRRKHIEEGRQLKVNSIDMLLYEIQRKQQQVERVKETPISQDVSPQQQPQQEKRDFPVALKRELPTRVPVGAAP